MRRFHTAQLRGQVGPARASLADMATHPPYRSSTSSDTMAVPAAQRALQVAEAASWAVMVLGLTAASLVLVQSFLLGG